jgi:hypothetical protein
MSILKQNHSDPISPALRATTQIKNRAARLAETIIREWEHGFDALWNNPQATPAEVLAELGTDAAEVFELSSATCQFMAAILSGRLDEKLADIQAKIAAKPATTVHEDGSVTIDPV